MTAKQSSAQRVFHADARLVMDRIIVLEKKPRRVFRRFCFRGFLLRLRFCFGHAGNFQKST